MMRNLFDKETYLEVIDRIHNLTPHQPALWGKMNAAQMLAHTSKAFKVPLSKKKLPRMLIGYIIGPLIKHKLYNESPWKKNLPTAPNFIITDQRDFNTEKQNLLNQINKLYTLGPSEIPQLVHPMFGAFTPEQWGKSMYKHLDHHLRQFGV